MKIMLKLQPAEEYMEITVDSPISLEELVSRYSDRLPYQVIIARVDGKDEELSFIVEKDSRVEFLDMRSRSADLAYQYTLTMMYLKSVQDVMGDVEVEISNTLNKGIYTELKTDFLAAEEQVNAIEERMHRLSREDLLIGRDGDVRSIDDYNGFFYGLMAPSTGYIRHFELRKYRKGVLLRFPTASCPDRVPDFFDEVNLYRAFGESKKWHRLLDVAYLADLNEKIRSGKAKDLVLLSEALHEKKIAEIADRITKEGKRIILIAGPSSSGKTTFARRLCIQLRVNGLEPLYMGTDDYFVERKDTPLGADGKPDYENLDAMDLELFNSNMNDLLAGKKVDLPEFDFIDGTKNFGKRITSIHWEQPIVIEGIHALNDEMTAGISPGEKFKIYISPFTQLSVDVHNRVPTTDVRMIRRMVRDYKYRGHSADDTIIQWPKVRAGEDQNIFPFNGEADVVFNSALVYELAVLKKYAEPLLEGVAVESQAYSEAARLLKFVRYFDVMEDETFIPNNSILREFIGGSIYVG